MRTLSDFILVELDPIEKSNIILLENNTEHIENLTGTVISVGDGENVQNIKVDERVYIIGQVRGLTVFGKKIAHVSHLDFLIFDNAHEEKTMRAEFKKIKAQKEREIAANAIMAPSNTSLKQTTH